MNTQKYMITHTLKNLPNSIFRCLRKRNAGKSDGSDVCHPGALLNNATQNFDIGLNAAKFYFA